MPHLLIPRDRVRHHFEGLGGRDGEVGRCVRRQGELGRFLFDLELRRWPALVAEVATWEIGQVLATFAREGGTVGRVPRARIDERWDEVRRWASDLGPFDRGPDGFARRVRELSVRSRQPHVVDQWLEVMLLGPPTQAMIVPDQQRQVFVALWAAVDVIDEAWDPPEDQAGEETYVPVDAAPWNPHEAAEAFEGEVAAAGDPLWGVIGARMQARSALWASKNPEPPPENTPRRRK